MAAERVIVRQDKDYGTEFLAADPENEASQDVEAVAHLHDLTPYGMLLASIASCTAVLLTSYAANHHLPLELVELDLTYGESDVTDAHSINVLLSLHGPLSEEQRQKLLKVSEQCPIEQMVSRGLRIQTQISSSS